MAHILLLVAMIMTQSCVDGAGTIAFAQDGHDTLHNTESRTTLPNVQNPHFSAIIFTISQAIVIAGAPIILADGEINAHGTIARPVQSATVSEIPDTYN